MSEQYVVVTAAVFTRRHGRAHYEGHRQFAAYLTMVLPKPNLIGSYQFHHGDVCIITHWAYSPVRPMLPLIYLKANTSHCTNIFQTVGFRFSRLDAPEKRQELKHVRRLLRYTNH